MKIKHKTNLLLRFATVFLFVALTFACKQSNKNKPQTPVKPESPISKEGEIEIKVKKGEEYVALNAVLPKSGIPYTATEKEINPEEKIVLKISAKDATYFKAKIVSPEKDAPLTITGSANLFDLIFKKVNKATPVQIRFSYSEKTTPQNIIYKDVKFTVLPEPAIEKVEAQDVTLIIGVDHDITQTPLTFITSPEKIGEVNAIDYILQDSKKITYGQSSDTTVATIDETTGKVHTIKNGETNIPLLCNNVKKGDLKIIVEDKCIPKKLIATPNHVKLKVGKTQDIVLTATPNNAVLDIGDWRNDNPEVGKIEKKDNDAGTYTITALKKGRVSFSATSKYSYNVFVFVTLEASDEDDVEKVELDKKVAELVFNESVQLTAKVFPATASQEVAWKKESIPGSLPDNILTHVVATGKVTAKDNTGYLKVVALSVKDGTKQDECLVSIASRKIEKVTTTQNEITMLTNAESMFECEIEPLGAADKLECMGASDNLKVKMAKINDTNKYSCTLKAGENTEDIKLTFFCPTNPDKKVEVTVHIKKVAGSIGSLSIEGEEAMYISETVEFTNKLTGNTSSIPNAEKAVEWTLQGDTNITEYFLLTKKNDGSVSLTIPAEKRNANHFFICCQGHEIIMFFSFWREHEMIIQR